VLRRRHRRARREDRPARDHARRLPAAGRRAPARIAGRRAAAEAILWGDVWPAADALRLGLVSEVVAADQLDARVAARAARATQMSAVALRQARKAMRRGAVGPIDEALRAVEEAYLNELMRSEDASEGLQRSSRSAPPTWRHR